MRGNTSTMTIYYPQQQPLNLNKYDTDDYDASGGGDNVVSSFIHTSRRSVIYITIIRDIYIYLCDVICTNLREYPTTLRLQ